MSKSFKRYRDVENDGHCYSGHKIKALKRREIERKLVRLEYEDYLDDEELSSYVSDPKFLRAIKEYN